MRVPARLVRTACLLFAVTVPPACTASAPGAPPPSEVAAAELPAFVNRVWKVAESPTVQAGQLYVFLSDGTLVVTAETSKPALGAWRQENGRLMMVEEGITYTVDVLSLTMSEFRIHINDPGEGVDLRLVPADDPPAK